MKKSVTVKRNISFKNTVAIAGLVVATVAAPISHAASTEAKMGASFFTTSILGAVAAGPVGFIAGALGGAYMGEQIKKADTMKATEKKLADTEAQMAELQQQLLAVTRSATQMEQLALNSLKFQVLFHTGKDQLTPRGQERVQALAAFLNENPKLHIRLEGHADPRGTDEYNNVLSEYRARSVEADLIAAGVEESRIKRHAFGADQSTAATGDAEGYAMERRVGIEVYNPQSSQRVGQVH